MQTEYDFRGKNLHGQSFKNQDLKGANFSACNLRGMDFSQADLTKANFSDCDLRGVNFSQADLTNTKFCHSLLGRTPIQNIVIFFAQFLAGFWGGLSLPMTNLIFCLILNEYHIQQIDTISISLSYTAIFGFFVIYSFNKKQIYIIFLCLLCIFIFVGFSEGLKIVPVAIGMASALGVTIIVIILFAISITISGYIPITIAIIGAIAGSIVTIFINIGVDRYLGIGSATLLMLLGLYLIIRTRKNLEETVLFLRNFGIWFNCLGGTQFAFARLNEVDFSSADLKYARFKNANIKSCKFLNAKNHHLAQTRYTPLETYKVRKLVIDGIVIDKDFSSLDLRGLDFSNLNLEGFDFSYANLYGADLSHSKMTGATLERWNIDIETLLDDIDCRYFYYFENGKKKRRPSEEKEYQRGEFTNIYKKFAKIISFTANNEAELAAINLSVKQVSKDSGNNDIRVQAIEEKGSVVIVKVVVPKTENRGILYNKISILTQKIQFLSATHQEKIKGYESRINDLKEQLKEQRKDLVGCVAHPINVNVQQKNTMDKNTKITGSTINNEGIMSFAEINGKVTQTIQQLPIDNHELKALLSQLQDIINNCPLSEKIKQEALRRTQEIAEATQQPKKEQNTVQKTLSYFDSLANSLENIPDIAMKLSTTIAQVSSLFGL